MPPRGPRAGAPSARAERSARRHGETLPTSADEGEDGTDDDAGGFDAAGSAHSSLSDHDMDVDEDLSAEPDVDEDFDAEEHLADPPPYAPPQPAFAGRAADGAHRFVGVPLFRCARPKHAPLPSRAPTHAVGVPGTTRCSRPPPGTAKMLRPFTSTICLSCLSVRDA